MRCRYIPVYLLLAYSSADEWKVYGNPMIKELEENAVEEDFINGAVTNVIAVADDFAPCAVGDSPREALHRMQILLNIVEVHGIQNVNVTNVNC